MSTAPARFTRLRAAAAALGLVLLVAGIPAALIVFYGNPLPNSLPTWSEATGALIRPDHDGSLFLAALTWIGWVAWASFVVPVLGEIWATLRGIPAPRIPGLGLQQHAAGVLVGAVVVGLVTGPVATAEASAVHTPARTAVEAPSMATGAGDDDEPGSERSEPGDQTEQSQPEREPAPTHTVRRGDSLWSIAERALGHGTRYQEIAELNYNRAQPDGHALRADHWIEPGWQLVLPADADTDELEPSAATARQRRYTAQPGDTLSSIAAAELGDADRWAELAEATREVVQPDGAQLSDPDHIRAGWTIVIPGAEPDPSPATEPDAHEPDESQSSEPEVDEAAAAAGSAVAAASDLAAQMPSPGGADDAPQTATNAEVDDDAVAWASRTTLGVGALLAAGLVSLIALGRRRQQRHLRPGASIPMPQGEEAATEQALRGVANPIGTEVVDRALRGLALHCAEQNRPLPTVRVARLTPAAFEIYLAEPDDLPAPWWATTEPTLWILDSDVDDTELVDAATAAQMPAPYPALVVVGQDTEDAHVLLDLEHCRALNVHTPDGGDILRAMATELAVSQWADDVTVTVVGTCSELPATLDTGRLRHVEDLDQLVQRLRVEAEHDRELLDQAATDDPRQARITGQAADWSPEIVLIAKPIRDENTRAILDDLVTRLPRVAITAVTTGTEPVTEWSISSTEPGTGMLHPLGLSIYPQVLTEQTYRDVLGIVGTTTHTEPSQTAHIEPELSHLGDPAPTVNETTEHAEPNQDASAGEGEDGLEQLENVVCLPTRAPLIRILGEVSIDRATGTPPASAKLRTVTEVASWVVLHPGAGSEALDEALWPGEVGKDTVRDPAVSSLRRWLGSTPDGEQYLPKQGGRGGYRMHPDVHTDWDVFQHLLAGGPDETSTHNLWGALRLVRGMPFTDTGRARRYRWADRTRQEIISAVTAAAAEAARRALFDRNPQHARQAAAIGLELEPGMELLWRYHLKAQHQAGNRAGIDSDLDELQRIIDDLDGELEPETIQLIHDLTRARHNVAV